MVAGAFDAEFFHAVAKRVGMQTENSCRTSQPLNNSTGLVKGGQDMISLYFFQSGES